MVENASSRSARPENRWKSVPLDTQLFCGGGFTFFVTTLVWRRFDLKAADEKTHPGRNSWQYLMKTLQEARGSVGRFVWQSTWPCAVRSVARKRSAIREAVFRSAIIRAKASRSKPLGCLLERVAALGAPQISSNCASPGRWIVSGKAGANYAVGCGLLKSEDEK